METMTTRQAIFLDRDGTLILDTGYPSDPALVQPVPGVFEAMDQFCTAGYALVVISNQSGIARGYITPQQARAVHDRFVQVFSDQGITFTGCYYCPHGKDEGCSCRKPNPGMLQQAAREHHLQFDGSWMMGDRLGDIEAGRRAGCRTILFDSQYVEGETGQADCFVTNWPDAVACVLASGAGT